MSETRQTRIGEELHIENLSRFLEAELGLVCDQLEVSQFVHGSSNLTYNVRTADTHLVLRRPPFGNTVRSAHDMWREYSVLSKLAPYFPPAPKPLAYCADKSVLGSEFFLMERRKGIVMRGVLTPEIKASGVTQKNVLSEFVETLADLHSVDIGRGDLAGIGKADGYVRRQVEGWSERYERASTGPQPDLEAAIIWLNENIPGDGEYSLVHNDYKFDNVMFTGGDAARVEAVLDWEMATVGSPLMDLGTTLGYWISEDTGGELLEMPFNPKTLMLSFSREDIAELYFSHAGSETADLCYYYVFGAVKIAAIAQQIYKRYVRGFTRDERFAGFERIVSVLGSIAIRAARSGRI